MEAVPRLPMINFDLLSTNERISFGAKLKPYIASFYQEDPESYNAEIHNLEGLRAAAVWPSININNCQLMKKYYCQLHFLKSRFPMEENQVCSIYFSWKDDFTKMSCSVPDVNFELMCLLINIGSIHSKLGAEDSRISPEGMKMSCTHFQCAAWAFQTVREIYGQMVGLIMISNEQIRGMQLVCLAQAQECILEKSLLDNRKATIIAKIAMQLSEYYRQAVIAFQFGEEGLISDHLPNNKFVIQYLHFKISYHRCIALLYQGQQAEEQQKMGERVAYYAAALEILQDASRQVSKMSSSNQAMFKDTVAFTLDVVEGKRKAATNENEFIYHEDVPQLDTLQEIKGASLVKGIPFQVQDIEVSGPDIFGRLVPMEAHEASSLYSEQKAQMLRVIGEKVDKKDQELSEFMSSLQLDVIQQMKSAKGLTQDLVDRAAEMVAKQSATKELTDAMGKLSNSYQEVEAMLREIQDLLKEEEQAERAYQDIMGKRPPSIIATDLFREAAKYQEAHGKASESNQNLHKAMTTHVTNLKILAQPISQLRMHIPSLQMPDPNIDENILSQMDTLVNKMDEMKKQRVNLWNQLREAVHQDDITGGLVTRSPDQPLDVFFQNELDKHKMTGALIDQNLVAQDNICKALVESYAQFTPTRKYLQDFIFKRNNTIAALNASYDSYDDLLAKANKGIEFYAKLETNVSKLLQRIKSACKVQQEERDQILLKNGHVAAKYEVETTTENSNKPKLKDYLDSMKEKRVDGIIGPTMQYPTSSMYPSQDPPVWQNNEPQNPQEYIPSPSGYTQNYSSPPVSSSNYGSYGYTQVNYSDKNVDEALANRMNALKIPSSQYDFTNSQAYNYPPVSSYSAPATSYNLTNGSSLPTSASPQLNMGNYSNPPASYQTVNSTNYPYIATSEQYNPGVTQNGVNTNTQAYGLYTNTNTGPVVSSTATNYYEQKDHSNVTQQYYNYVGANADQSYPQYFGNKTNDYGNQVPTTLSNYPQSNTANIQYSQPQSTYNTQYPAVATTSANAYQVGSYPTDNNITNYQNATDYNQISNNYQYPSTSYGQGNNPYSTTNNLPYQTFSSENSTYQNITYPPTTTNNVYPSSYPNNIPNSSTLNAAQNMGYGGAYPVTSTPNTNNQHQNVNYQNPTTDQVHKTANDSTVYNQNIQYPNTQSYPEEYYNQYTSYNTQYPSTPYTQMNYQQPTPPTTYTQPSSSTEYITSTTNYPQPPLPINSNQPSSSANYNQPSSSTNYNQPSSTSNYNQPTNSSTFQPPEPAQPKIESSIDLLAGLDFSISQAPLIPQKETKTEEIKEILPPKKEEKKLEEKKVSFTITKKDKVLKKGDPFRNPEMVNRFIEEVDRFEKYVEGLNLKTLSGPSNLELKWKEIQDCQENVDATKRSISVARCYPLKNRSPDILPYDYSRVELTTEKDDYINASQIKDVTPYCMDYIVTQNPMNTTVSDFWAMVWEQQVELIVCLLSTEEMKDEIYWPLEIGKQMQIGTKSITTLSSTDKNDWTERKIHIAVFEQKERIITLLQYTTWPGSLFPTNPLPFVDFAKRIITLYEQQKCSGNPVLVHCLVGVGRSGICSVLLAVLMEFAATASPLPDIPNIACKMSCARKNILRDREHLKFIYIALLRYAQVIKREYTRESDTEKADDDLPVEKAPIDPLSTLDPLWATRKP